ncbi:Cmx/CmrA family chloramphenicol efflux MFS transporter [Cellulomonas taurus]|uniref:Cmx/CmrA family chloramphenicol efflux MFS transporter n=1 Tax=Cellulomonas taurus TaxID=2729175 RepID=UPI00145E2101|nr:Cmx/CmrA family chloramphenicol efflux MFS transporter [Cellulomonas taurus]
MPAVLYLLAVATFAQGTSEFVLAGLLPLIAADLGLPLAHAGLLTSGFALGMVIGAPTMAAAARRLSPRWALAGFLALFITAHAVGALTGSFAVLLASRIVAALANAGFLAVTLSTVTRIVPPARHARALALILGGTTLALIAGVPAGAVIGEAIGWRATLWAIALLCVPTVPAVLASVPARTMTATDSAVSIGREVASLRSPTLRLPLVLAVLVNAATFCSFTYLTVIATGLAGLPDRMVPFLLAAFGVGAFLGVWVAGRFGDRHGRRRITVAGPLLLAGWVVLALTAATPAALWTLILTQGTLSFTVGSTLIARIVAAAHAAPTLGGSFATTALNVGAVIGPLVGGFALDAVGPRGPSLVSAVLVLLAVVLWGCGHADTRRDAPVDR